MPRQVSAGLSLAAACCRWPPSSAREWAIRAAACQIVDWKHFEAVADRNRISALIHHGLARAAVDLPDHVTERLSQRAASIARRSLAMARETLSLQRELEAAGLPCLTLKGASLASLAYDDLGIKESRDIDFLVPRKGIREAIEVVEGLGYESPLSRLTGSRFDTYLNQRKEAVFLNRATGFALDLHWGLVDSPRLLRDIDIGSPSQEVSVPGGRLRTLADEQLFAYLCVHGSLHNWARLKWLADLAAFLSRFRLDRIEQLHSAAEEHGAVRAASVALFLCRRLLGVELSDDTCRRCDQDRIALALATNAVMGLEYKGGVKDCGPWSVGRLRKIAAELLVAPGLPNAMRRVGYYWNSPVDRMQLSLPPQLSFLYHILRVPLWLARRTLRAFHGLRS